MPGWKTDLSGFTKRGQLPQAALDYLDALEASIGVPIGLIGVGPGRNQIVHYNQAA
jgi:adenylosuccinate synthase